MGHGLPREAVPSVFVERRTVSRKTPGDGRLEITKDAAQRVERLGRPVVIDVDGESARGSVATFACTCRGAETPHVHYFLESERLKQLLPGTELDVELDENAGRVILRARRV
jgi:hypothetical protein